MPKRDWKHKISKSRFDWPLFLLTVGLTLFGLAVIYNASSVEAFTVFEDKYYYLKNQSLWAAIGIVLMIVVSFINYRLLEKFAAPAFFINLILLGLVLIPFIGAEIKGARRWINLGLFSFQPAELVKLTLSVYLASWLLKTRRFIHFLALVGLGIRRISL
jgi:cell division protein FtsW